MKPPSPQQLILWTLLTLPAAVVQVRYAAGALGYGEVLHFSGDWSARLLILVMAVSPLRLAFPRAGWTGWLVRRRRDLGVAAFGYALWHLVIYFARKVEMPVLILREGVEPGMAAGWIAFVLLALLALTSNDASVRRLKRGWKVLHRLVYPAAVLTFAHWLMTAFELREGLIHAAVLAAVVAARLFLQRRRAAPRAG